MSDTQSHDNVTTSSTATPGELLSRQREALGVPLSDAARALNLRPAVVDGLEQNNYDEIPVAAYRRGYLRAYARYLGMDDRLVLDAYQASHGNTETDRRVTPVSITRPPSRIGAWLFKLVTLLVIIGLIAVTVMWWQSRGGSEPPSMGSTSTLEEENDLTTSPSAPPTTAPDQALVSTPQLPSSTSEEPEETVESTVSDAIVATDSADIDPVTSTEEATESTATATADTSAQADSEEEVADAEPAANPNLLELTFNEQSWTEIFDANNQRVFVGLQTPGTTASVEGEPPFRLTIGNSTGVELRYQGETINLRQRAGANNVARFTLGE
ncbi:MULTISPECIES: RodZ domain-containing protein [Vreelandella]|uniref:Helix-turn-helix domain-containing protein n=2 Tax=Vreelandella TaxID=3137766 RepID=A0A7C9K6B9_9GAMM|nr:MULTISPECIES: RodZ domain-containing protein [Halomonas]NDL70339.1 helix-turn-helix domain-containing protein [Halomonas alkaliphila]NYS45169.1 helix-turn-helix domain-containing protein [Halomonas zhaodongensis]